MIFIVGVLLQLFALVLLVFFLRKMKQPKAEAYIDEITLEYVEKDKQKIKKHPHGHIKYVYRSIEYKAVILLLKRKMNSGDQIMVSFKEDHPEKPTMYAPKQELMTVIILSGIGFVLIGISVFTMDYFNLW